MEKRNYGLEDARRMTSTLKSISMDRMRRDVAKRPEDLLNLLGELIHFKEDLTNERRSAGSVENRAKFNETVEFIKIAYEDGDKPIVIMTIDTYPRAITTWSVMVNKRIR